MDEKKLVLKVVGTEYSFQLDEDFKRKIKFNGKEYEVEVPKGFYTDMATIPKPLWSWLSPFGKYQESAVLHDYLYAFAGKLKGLDRVLNRKECDELFYQVMIQDGTSKQRAKLMKNAVRLFGWKYWKKKTER